MLGAIVLFFVAVNLAASALGYFGDILLTFLAWLLAFIISPVVTSIVDLIPGCRGSSRWSSSIRRSPR